MDIADTPERAQLKAACEQRAIVIVFLVMLCWATTSIALHKRWPKTPPAPLWSLALFVNLVLIGGSVGRLTVYFGVPPILTFGYRIEPILPATCEASLPIMGPDGLPCSLKRFLEWARGESDWRLESFEWQWISKGASVGFLVTIAIGLDVSVLLVTWMVEHDEREKERMHLEAEKGV